VRKVLPSRAVGGTWQFVLNNNDYEERDAFDIQTKVVAVVHPDATLHVPGKLLVDRCDLFGDDARLAAFLYHLKAPVSMSDVREFVSGLEGTTAKVTNNNFQRIVAALRKTFSEIWLDSFHGFGNLVALGKM
jgi:hypothetical protein